MSLSQIIFCLLLAQLCAGAPPVTQFTKTEGSFKTPLHPQNYPNNYAERWIYVAPRSENTVSATSFYKNNVSN
jgi:hypothetical protein